MGECAGVKGVPVAATKAFDAGNIPPSTRSGEREISKKSEGKTRANNMCAAIITAGDKGVEAPTTQAVDTSDVTVAGLMAATTDIGKALRIDVVAEV